MILTSTSSQSEVMKGSSTLKKSGSKSERKRELKSKLQLKYLQSEKTMLSKDFLKFNFKV